MIFLWSFKAMTEKQLFWTTLFFWTFYVFSLLENQVAADSTTTVSPSSTSNISALATTANIITNVTTVNPITTAALTIPSGTSNTTEESHSTNSTSSPTNSSSGSVTLTVQPTSTQASNVSKETSPAVTSAVPVTSASTVPENNSFSSSLIPTEAGNRSDVIKIECLDNMQKTTSKFICLELNETYSCQVFRKQKGAQLTELVCKNQTSCPISLATSENNPKCILLLKAGDKGVDALAKVLQEQMHTLNMLGIKYKLKNIESHQGHSRKTLIALVTSGLLLAFLGLAGYFLMKRRSWSPMGERLGEDPYYTETGSHGNPVISVDSHEQSNLQEKPNLNGGARENGTGQPASKNGHSARPHVVADTEL